MACTWLWSGCDWDFRPKNMTPKVQTCAQHKKAIWLLLLASALSNGAMEIGSACEANGKSGNGVSPSGWQCMLAVVLGYIKTLVITGRAFSLPLCTKGLLKCSSHFLGLGSIPGTVEVFCLDRHSLVKRHYYWVVWFESQICTQWLKVALAQVSSVKSRKCSIFKVPIG